MRRSSILAIAVLLLAASAAAQQASAPASTSTAARSVTSSAPLPQGSLQLVTASLMTTGDPVRTGGLQGFTPDFGVTWLRPTTAWGTLNFDAHAVRNNNDPRLGRALFGIKDMKRGGLTWNLSAGDSAYTPYLTDYGFNNLFAPQVTFRGGSVSAKSDSTSLSVTAGRTTVYRDLFGANADTLGQSLFVARASQKITSRMEVVSHASRVRTEDLKGYSYLIESGDDAGAGVRVNIAKGVQFIGDAGITSYRRKGSVDWEQMPSLLVGARWTGKSGWLQVDAHRFSPGNFSVVNNPYADREGVFAAGEYEFAKRLRLFGGWDMFRNNRQAAASSFDNPWNKTTSSRGYAGARMKINSHLFVGGRWEDGARVSQPSRYTVGYESDTGAKSIDWQVNLSRFSAVGRYQRRSNVDVSEGLVAPGSTMTQQDLTGQLFFTVTSTTRIFGSWFRTERRDRIGSGQSFWQGSLGAQFQAGRRVTAHTEVVVSRNRDMQSDFLTPRSAFSGGLYAQIAKHVALTVDVFIDRSPAQMIKVNPWMSRTMVRLVYNVPTGGSAGASMVPGAPKLARGNETIEGTVFVDWNGNGTREADEEVVSGVRVILDSSIRVTADDKGRFRFDHIVAGEHLIALDVPTVPADFDPPALTGLDMKLRHSEIPKVGFGLVPLGDIDGVVLLDVNGNSAFDENDQPVDGAVVVLDDGSRTEVARNGMFRFSGVRVGTHTVQLLLESLADDAALVGERQTEVRVTRDQRAPVAGFLVRTEKRPEIRKIFVPKKNNNNNNNDGGNGSRLDRNDTGATKSRSGASRSSYSRSRSNSKSSESKSSK